jgi:hypothetical protein
VNWRGTARTPLDNSRFEPREIELRPADGMR